ncbi:MAG: hypothetical protein AMXMBFR46_15390 [Acidimicrobiia bacterium]
MVVAVCTVAIAGLVVVGLGIGIASADGGSGRPALPEARDPACVLLQARAGEVPGIQARIEAHVDDLEARIAGTRDPGRRTRVAARLQPRIDRLHELAAALTARAADAARRCGDRHA